MWPVPGDLVMVTVWILLIPVNGQDGRNEPCDGQGFLHLSWGPGQLANVIQGEPAPPVLGVFIASQPAQRLILVHHSNMMVFG